MQTDKRKYCEVMKSTLCFESCKLELFCNCLACFLCPGLTLLKPYEHVFLCERWSYTSLWHISFQSKAWTEIGLCACQGKILQLIKFKQEFHCIKLKKHVADFQWNCLFVSVTSVWNFSLMCNCRQICVFLNRLQQQAICQLLKIARWVLTTSVDFQVQTSPTFSIVT